MSNCGSRPKKMRDGGPSAPIMPEEAKEIRKKKRKERNASREQTRRPPESAYKEMLMEETGNSISNADKARLKELMGEVAKKMAYGGAVDSSNCRGMGSAIRGGSFKGTF